jgi:hypothetical protein
MMRADARLAGDADLLERMIVGDEVPDWRRVQADLGLTNAAYRGLGIGPLFTEVGEPAATRFTVRQTGRAPLAVDA